MFNYPLPEITDEEGDETTLSIEVADPALAAVIRVISTETSNELSLDLSAFYALNLQTTDTDAY